MSSESQVVVGVGGTGEAHEEHMRSTHKLSAPAPAQRVEEDRRRKVDEGRGEMVHRMKN